LFNNEGVRFQPLRPLFLGRRSATAEWETAPGAQKARRRFPLSKKMILLSMILSKFVSAVIDSRYKGKS
jgi:hypothetical protein